jgi:putative copper resistance protein D
VIDMFGVVAHAGPGDLPPPWESGSIVTTWSLEVLPLIAILAVMGLYLAGVITLRRRGVAWPVGRTFSFVVIGMGSALFALQSALAAYDTVLISVHMVQHMVLSMVVPIFTAMGAPITLALRTLPVRGRRLLLVVLHSRVSQVLTHPVVAGSLFILNPFFLYFSGLYELSLRNGLVHDWMHLHFVIIGTLWFWPLLGIDPMPRRAPYPLRLIMVMITLPFHAFLGVVIMQSTALIAEDWYLALGRTWGLSPLEDQRLAGGILWATGDLVGVVVFAVLFAGWVRSSEREAVREDRRLDRLGLASVEYDALNARLARQAELDASASAPPP